MWKAYSVFSDFNPSMQSLLKQHNVSVTCSNGNRPTEQELIDLFYKYDILIIGESEKLTKKIFKTIDRPRIIASLSNNLNHIDSIFFNSSLIRIVYCKTAHIISSAEYVIGLMLMLEKRMLEASQTILELPNHPIIQYRSVDIYKKTLGIIGIDDLTRTIIKMCSVFDMNMVCYTQNIAESKDLLKSNIQIVDIITLLKEADVIIVNLQLENNTKGLFSKDMLSFMKKDATYIHISDPSIVDIDYLVQMAIENPNFHVGLDIPIQNYPILKKSNFPNLFVTPHIAHNSLDTIHRMDGEITHQILSIIKTEERK